MNDISRQKIGSTAVKKKKQRKLLSARDYPTRRCLQQGIPHDTGLNLDSINNPLKLMCSRIPRPAGRPPLSTQKPQRKKPGANAGRSSCSNKVQGRGQRSEITGLNLLPKRGVEGGPFLKNDATKLFLAIYIRRSCGARVQVALGGTIVSSHLAAEIYDGGYTCRVKSGDSANAKHDISPAGLVACLPWPLALCEEERPWRLS